MDLKAFKLWDRLRTYFSFKKLYCQDDWDDLSVFLYLL